MNRRLPLLPPIVHEMAEPSNLIGVGNSPAIEHAHKLAGVVYAGPDRAPSASAQIPSGCRPSRSAKMRRCSGLLGIDVERADAGFPGLGNHQGTSAVDDYRAVREIHVARCHRD